MGAPLRVAFLSSEVSPWCATGGLGDVAGALPAGLRKLGADVAVFAPLYRGVRARVRARGLRLEPTPWSITLDAPPFGSARIWRLGGPAPVFFVDAPEHFDREGFYDAPGGGAFEDNPLRFAAFTRFALRAAPLVLGASPDVVHANDWQTGLAPVYGQRGEAHAYVGTRFVFTVHNLAYQGVAPKRWVERLGLSWSDFTYTALEHHDALNPLKAGIVFSQVVSTVSPTYAEEIQTPAFGEGLDAALRHAKGKLFGVVNGIDEDAWDPRRDAAIAATYDARRTAGKRACRAALLEEFGLEAGPRDLVLGVVSRLAHQKGLDVLADATPRLVESGVRVVMLGSGDAALAERWRRLASDHPGRVGVYIGFDIARAHRVEAGVDAFVMPSRYEPCGLNQLYSMRYGTVPIVHGVGGLRDTVVDAAEPGATGFVFAPLSAHTLAEAVARAAATFRDDRRAWRALQQRGMRRDSSWARSAAAYLKLYRGA